MPSSNWASYDAMFDLYLSVGMYSLAGYFFLDWTSSAVDPPSTASVGPDWMPAKDPDKFAPLMQHASWLGHLVGAYTAFNCMPDSAPGSVWDSTGRMMLARWTSRKCFSTQSWRGHSGN